MEYDKNSACISTRLENKFLGRVESTVFTGKGTLVHSAYNKVKNNVTDV